MVCCSDVIIIAVTSLSPHVRYAVGGVSRSLIGAGLTGWVAVLLNGVARSLPLSASGTKKKGLSKAERTSRKARRQEKKDRMMKEQLASRHLT